MSVQQVDRTNPSDEQATPTPERCAECGHTRSEQAEWECARDGEEACDCAGFIVGLMRLGDRSGGI